MIRAVLLAMMLAGPALACAVQEEFFVEDVATGPVVVLAEVEDFSRQSGASELQLAVREVWRGEAPARVTAIWGETLAEVPPETWTRPAPVVAALRPTERDGVFDLVVKLCGSAHLVEATPANIAAIKAALP